MSRYPTRARAPSCPICGRRPSRHRATRPPESMSLWDWADEDAKRHTRLTKQSAPALRVMLLHGYPDAEGQPRPAVMLPGRRFPTVFPSMAAALATIRAKEAPR